MANDIVMHSYDDFAFGQLAEDTQLGKKLVPIGYVNLTAMCQGNGKEFRQWKRLKRSKAYIEALSRSVGIPTDLLVIGNESEGSNDERGTWGHPEIAVSVAAWISPEFEVWANRTLRLVIAGDFTPKTADAAIAQSQLKQHHDRILDRAEAWKKLFDREFCQQVYSLGGPQFYWEFCYYWLTPTERCEIELKNPVVNGRRKDRIHQFFSEETKQRIAPYLAELAAIVNTADGDKQAFYAGFQKHFKGITQLKMF